MPPLVDCHRASGDGLTAIESWVPSYLTIPGVSISVVNDGVQVTDMGMPGVHWTVSLFEGVPGRLSGSAVSAVKPVRFDGDAVFAGTRRHLFHVAIDLHVSEKTALSQLK